MDNKINIKELAKNLKNLPLTEGVKDKEPVDVIPPKLEAASPVPIPIEKKPKTEAKPVQPVAKPAPPEDLITTLQSDISEYDFSKQVWIDEEIYEILVHIKRREKIKNISILVTAIIEQYINQNRTTIVRLLNDKPRKI